jgi:fibronectin-binding autotransporter adhesin
MWTTAVRRVRALLVLLLAGAAAGAALAPGAALAVTSCPSGEASAWTNPAGGAYDAPANWSNGVPGGGCAASITLAGTYTVLIDDPEGADSLVLGGASGTQTLRLEGTNVNGSPQQARFGVANGQSLAVGSHGVVQLTSAGPDPGAAILGGGLLDNAGLVRTDPGTSGTSTFKDIRANVTNEPGGTIAFHADTTTCACGSGGTWINQGTLTTDAGTSSTLSRTGAGIVFTQPAGTGSIVNHGTFEVDGSLSNAAGTTAGNPVEVCGSLDPSGPGAASFAFAQRTVCNGWELAGDVGAGTTVLARNASTTGSITVGTAGALTNHGTLSLDGVPGSPQTQLVGSGTLTNAGTLQVLQPGSSLITTPLTNTGTVTLASGSALEVRNVIHQSAGSFALAAGSSLSTGYDVTLSGGTLGGAGRFTTTGTFTHSGGATTGAPIVICSGSLAAAGPGTASFELPGPDGGCGNPTIAGDVGAGDTIDVHTASGTLDVFFSSFVNRGTLRLDGGATNQLHGTQITNEGTFDVADGTANMALQLINHGALEVGPGAVMNFNAPPALESGSATVDGTLGAGAPIPLTGGTLQGTGTLGGGLENSGGTVHPGHSPGILHVTGDYDQGAGGRLAIDVAGTAAGSGHSQLAVTGAASLAGTLAVTTPSAVTGTLRVLSAGSVAGTFAPVSFSGQAFAVGYDATGVLLTGTAPVVVPTPTPTPTPAPSPTPKPGPRHQALTGVHVGAKRLRFRLVRPAKVTLRLTHRVAGRLVGRHCRAGAGHGRRCSATVTVARLRYAGRAGANSFRLRLRRLEPGRYTATLRVPGAPAVTRKLTVHAPKGGGH